jgi:gliding motility-associated-like protein
LKTILAWLLTALCMSSTVSESNAQRYWVGGNGTWHNVANWAQCPACPGGASIPTTNTDVFFLQSAAVLLANEAHCRNLTVAPAASLSLAGTQALVVMGDVAFSAPSTVQLPELRFAGNSNFLPPSVLNADVKVLPNASMALNGALIAPEKNMHILSGAIESRGFAIACASFFVPSGHAILDVVGSKIYVRSEVNIHPAVQAEQTENTLWPHDDAIVNPGPLNVAWARTSTCGTGPGQTPFTITASVASNYNGQNISCNGADDGIATVSVVGGSGNFSYQWIGGPSPGFSPSYTGLGAGTYTVLVTDITQGITCVDNVQFAEPPALTIFTFISTPPSCDGECDGTATPITIGGVAPYTYVWGNGEANTTATALCEGPTTLFITDLNGCTFSTTYDAVLNEIQANLTTVDVLCNGTPSGEASVSPTGGAGGPYIVQWSAGATGNTATGLAAGQYSVDVTDVGGCTLTTNFAIAEEPPILVSVGNSVNPTCFGETTGSAEASASGGTPPYVFAWTGSNGYTASTTLAENMPAGSFTVTVTDQNGCFATANITLTAPPELIATATITDVVCNGESTGSIAIAMVGGTPGYGFNWVGDNGFTSGSQNILGLSAGSYTLTVTDAAGCDDQQTFTITEPAALAFTATVTDVICNGGNDGAIAILPSGGTPPYTATWVNGAFNATGEIIANLVAGTYTLTLTDAEGCEIIADVVVSQPDLIDIAIDITPISCNGSDDATITAIVTGGNAPYTYFWTGPHGVSFDPQILNAAPGAYNLTVTDADGCEQMATAILQEPDPILLVPVITDVSCGGLSDGAIDLSILGGTPAYSVVWTGLNGFTASTEDLMGLLAGAYDVVVTDLAGCQITASYTVAELPPLDLVLTVTPISCNGADDGAISLNINGGQGPFGINWAGPNLFISTDQNISNLEPGLYNLLVIDANGCSEEAFATLDEPDPISFTVDTVDPLCANEATGSITVTASAGQAPLTILWSNGASDFDLQNLAAGTYSATITDAGGCSVPTGDIELVEAPEILLQAALQNIACNGGADGSIDLTVSGGLPPYTVAWTGDNGFTSDQFTLTNLPAGSYTVEVVDANNCLINQSYTLDEPDPIAVAQSNTAVICADDLTDITLAITGGTPPYQVVWMGDNGFTSTDQNLVGVNQGDYFLDLQDAAGCLFSALYTIQAPDPLLVSGDVTALDCTGDLIGAVDLNIVGGQAPYAINWTGSGGFNSFDEDIANLGPGIYTVTVTDNLGCVITTAFSLTEPDALVIDATVVSPDCGGADNGSIAVVISSGVAPYTLVWSGDNGFTSTASTITDLPPGSYTLEVTDSGTCTETAIYTLTEPDALAVASNVTNILCGGEATGAINITVAGGTPPYQYVWSGNGLATTDEDVFDLSVGSYHVDVLDANGCSIDAIFNITEAPALDASVSTTDSTCGDANGSAEVTASGGTGALEIVWFDGGGANIGTSTSITNLSAGNYSVEITDALGCTLTLNVNISDSDAVALDANPTNPLCAGDSNGAVNLSATGGTGVLTFTWNGPNGFTASGEDIADLIAGSYTVNVTDELGCFSALTVDLTEADELTATADITNVSCNATDDGAIDLTVSGGTEPYAFAWTGSNGFSATTADISNLEPGSYEVLITDAQLCSFMTEITVIQTTLIDLDFSVTDVACGGSTTGSISTIVLSGTAPFDVAWTSNTGFTSSDLSITDLAAGLYTLNISDAEGCTVETALEVFENAPINLSVDQTLPNCLTNNGALLAQVTGGSGVYLYLWYDVDNGNTLIGSDALLENVASGNYFVEVIDDLGCEASASISLSDDTGDLSASITAVSCFGADDGAIDLTVTGATEPLVILWSGPNGFTSSNQDLTNLAPGDYLVQVDDALGCSIFETYTILESADLTVSGITSEVLCFGDSNGTIQLTISGGNEPYETTWTGDNNFSSNQLNLSDLAIGCYTVEVIDINTCTTALELCILGPDELIVSHTLTEILCNGDTSGAIELEFTGGTGNIDVSWEGPNGYSANTANIQDLAEGSYIATIQDGDFCTSNYEVEVTAHPAVQAEITLQSPGCEGQANGTILLTISGGSAPYAVEWFDANGLSFASGAAISDLTAGTYTFVITDALGCILEDSVDLNNPAPIVLDASVQGISCEDGNDGSIELAVDGGTGPYNAQWAGPNGYTNSGLLVENLLPGSYEVTITDVFGCSVQATYQVVEPDGLLLAFDEITSASCFTSVDGSISILVEGGVLPYSFVWSGPNGFTADTPAIGGLVTGSYGVVVTDGNGCSQTISSIPIGFTGDVVADAGADAAFCFGVPLTLNGSNTGANSSYWTDVAGNVIQVGDTYTPNLDPGVYTLVYAALEGNCLSTDTLEIEVFALPVANAGLDQSIYVDTQTVIGGNPTTEDGNLVTWLPSEFLLSDDEFNPTTTELMASVIYYLEVIDANGCAAIDSVWIEVIPNIDVPSGFTPNDDGMNDVWVIADADDYPSMLVEVYNRWGELLYREANGYNRPWDGRYGGNPLPIGTYYYVIEINEPDFKSTLTGPVTIIR